jgi:hypothetical protein
MGTISDAVEGHSGNPHSLTGSNDTTSNFASIGNQDLVKQGFLIMRRRRRKGSTTIEQYLFGTFWKRECGPSQHFWMRGQSKFLTRVKDTEARRLQERLVVYLVVSMTTRKIEKRVCCDVMSTQKEEFFPRFVIFCRSFFVSVSFVHANRLNHGWMDQT